MEELKLILETVKHVSDGVLWVVIIHYVKSLIVVAMWVSVWIFLFLCIKNIIYKLVNNDKETNAFSQICRHLEVVQRKETTGHGYDSETRRYYHIDDAIDKINNLKEGEKDS